MDMMKLTQTLVENDYYRYTGNADFNIFKLIKMRKNHAFMSLYWFRRSQGTGSKLLKKIYRHYYNTHAQKNGIEIPSSVNLRGGY